VTAEVIRTRVLVSGRVQDVFYRATCADEAERAGVVGWVRNLPDGRVEAAFEGSPEAVERMVGWCGEGPPAAKVTDVDAHDEPLVGEKEFLVR
jgi:acylphosphatase